MIPLKVVPLFGSGIASKSYVVTRQRRLNCYYERREDKDKTAVAVLGTPGLVAAFQPDTQAGFPMRAMLGTQSDLYVCAYNSFRRMSGTTGVSSFSGTLSTIGGQMSMANNATQVVMVDGVVAYIYTIGTPGTFATIGASFPNGAKTITFVSSFFVAEQPGTQKFWVSNANDGSTWNALAFASASAYSDNILAVDNLGGNLILFGEQHLEPWQNVGTTPQPFAPILSAVSEYGLAAIFSRAHVNESIIFLGQTREGEVQFIKLKGFNTQNITDPDIGYIVNQLGTVSDAVAMAWEEDEHKFYQISFPSANRTFLYDDSTGIWSEMQTGTSVLPSRHTANLSAYFAGNLLIADYATNQIYRFDPNTFTDNGQTIIREVITRHVLSQFNRIRVSSLFLDMETGVGLQTGQGSNPQIMLQYSKDDGRTWSAERWVSLGAVGQYLTRVFWRRFGSTRTATFRIRMSDPVKFVITQGAMRIRQKIPRKAA